MEEGDRLIGLMVQACERLAGSVFDAMDEAGFHGLTATQALAIRMLSAGPLPPRDLARHLAVTQQAASRITQDLRERGLVDRGNDPADARMRPVVLTPEGSRAARAMLGAERQVLEGWRAAAGDADLEATARALAAYLASTEHDQAPARPWRLSFR